MICHEAPAPVTAGSRPCISEGLPHTSCPPRPVAGDPAPAPELAPPPPPPQPTAPTAATIATSAAARLDPPRKYLTLAPLSGVAATSCSRLAVLCDGARRPLTPDRQSRLARPAADRYERCDSRSPRARHVAVSWAQPAFQLGGADRRWTCAIAPLRRVMRPRAQRRNARMRPSSWPAPNVASTPPTRRPVQ
jgi:hypothetical protein